MVGNITENSDVLNHKLYFDNFFSCYKLMCELAEQDVVLQKQYERIEQLEQIKTYWIQRTQKEVARQFQLLH